MAYSPAVTAEDLERAKIGKRNYVKAPTEFKHLVHTNHDIDGKIANKNTKFHRWHAIDEECFNDDGMPPEQTVVVKTMTYLRQEVSKFTEQVGWLKKFIPQNEDNQNR